MKHIIILLLLSFSSGLFAQQIVSVKDNGKAPYTYAGERLDMRGLGVILEPNQEAYDLYKRAKGTNVTANILAGGGGFLLGYQLGNALSKNNGQEFNAAIFGVGVLIAGTGIAISSGANKRMVQAVELYNRDFPRQDNTAAVSLQLGTTTDGVGLVVRF